MNWSLRQRWITALRTGGYIQTFGALERETGGVSSNCCLGVLCRVKGYISEPVGGVVGFRRTEHSITMTGGLSREMLEDVGLSREVQGKLVQLNDANKMSFARIADWIEFNVPTDKEKENAE